MLKGGAQKEERERKEAENLFEERVAENFHNPGKETDTQVQEAQNGPHRTNPRISSPRHTAIKMATIKDKEKILEAAREKQTVTYKGNPIRLSVAFYQKYCRPEVTGMIYLKC